MKVPPFIHLTIDRYLDSFQFGAVVNRAAMTLVDVFVRTHTRFFLEYIRLEVKFLGHSVGVCLTSVDTIVQTGGGIFNCTRGVGVGQLLHICANTGYCRSFIFYPLGV